MQEGEEHGIRRDLGNRNVVNITKRSNKNKRQIGFCWSPPRKRTVTAGQERERWVKESEEGKLGDRKQRKRG